MSSYNEQMAENNARLESILERIGNLSAGASYETCSFNISTPTMAQVAIKASRIVYMMVDSTGKVVVKTTSQTANNLTISDVLVDSYVYIEYPARHTTIGNNYCEIIATPELNSKILLKITCSAGGLATYSANK